MKLPAQTPHKPAAAVGAVLTVCTVLGLHTRLGLTDADLLRLLEALMVIGPLAFAYLPRHTKAES